MNRELAKYIGCHVEMIYNDADQRFTKRTVKILSVHGTHMLAYCMERRAVRSFSLQGILAVHPVPIRSSERLQKLPAG